MSLNAVYFFAKNFLNIPVKKRLAKTIGQEKANKIYHQLLNHTVSGLQDEKYSTIIFITPSYDKTFLQEIDWSGFIYPQIGLGLGERMYNAFLFGKMKGFIKQIIIGTDAPQISKVDINDAFDQLENKDVVISPSSDGGYSLLGMKKPDWNMFRDIEWSTDQVFTDTMSRIKELGMSVSILRNNDDIDYKEDLMGFLKRETEDKNIQHLKNNIFAILNEKI